MTNSNFKLILLQLEQNSALIFENPEPTTNASVQQWLHRYFPILSPAKSPSLKSGKPFSSPSLKELLSSHWANMSSVSSAGGGRQTFGSGTTAGAAREAADMTGDIRLDSLLTASVSSPRGLFRSTASRMGLLEDDLGTLGERFDSRWAAGRRLAATGGFSPSVLRLIPRGGRAPVARAGPALVKIGLKKREFFN